MQTLRAHIRWLVRQDMPAIERIERLSFAEPWQDADYRAVLRQRNCIMMVAEIDGDPVASVLYLLHRNHIEVVRLVVDPQLRRLGLGAALLGKLKDKTTAHRRSWVSMRVPETLLDAQRFLHACGFMAVGILPDYYTTDVDGVLFQWVRGE